MQAAFPGTDVYVDHPSHVHCYVIRREREREEKRGREEREREEREGGERRERGGMKEDDEKEEKLYM